VLSAAAMLDWLGTKHADRILSEAATNIRNVTNTALASGCLSADLGGSWKSADITQFLCERLARLH